MTLKVVLLALVFCTCLDLSLSATDKVVCYYGTWATYRQGNGQFTTEDIDPTLCTHLIYGFVGIIPDGNIRLLDATLDIDRGNFRRFNALKNVNPNLKTLVAIGGWNEGSINYSIVANDPSRRQVFIQSALNLVLNNGFDGFDLDWEYPGRNGGATYDKANYATLIKEFRAAFDQYGLLLTAAVGAPRSIIDTSYNVPALSQYLDLINIMTYDFHGSWDSVTGQNAPLYPASFETGAQRELNVDAAVQEWIRQGANPQKISLGLGVYGRSYTLANPSNNGLGAPVSGAGASGRYTLEAGMLGYNEIVELIQEGGWTSEFDSVQQTPYITKGNQWIGYDNPESIAIKVNYAKSLNLGAVMIWSIETEDFRGVSGTRYPILRSINAALGTASNSSSTSAPSTASSTPSTSAPTRPPTALPNSTPATQTTATPATRTTATSTTRTTPSTSTTSGPPSSGSLCQQEGYVKDPIDCTLFYYCLPYNGQLIAYPFQCNPGLVFDLENLICDYPENVQC